MRRELENFEQIDQYLEGKLSEADAVAFEQKLQLDENLRADVNAVREVNRLILDQGLLEIKSKLKALDKKPDLLSNGKKYLYSAILITMVAAVTTIYVVTRPAKIRPTSMNEVKTPSDVGTPIERTLPTNKETVRPKNKSSNQLPILTADSLVVSLAPQNILLPQRDTLNNIAATETTVTSQEPSKNTTDEKRLCIVQSSKLIVTVSETCTDDASGSITVDKLSSLEGKSPHEFSINGNTYFKGRTFGNLESGTYYLSIKDADGCTWLNAKEIQVGSKDCREHELSFYPSRGETFEFPIENDDNGKIVIYNKNGSIVYQAIITNGYPDRWDGTNNGGNLPMGSYSYMLQVNGKTTTGYITLFN